MKINMKIKRVGIQFCKIEMETKVNGCIRLFCLRLRVFLKALKCMKIIKLIPVITIGEKEYKHKGVHRLVIPLVIIRRANGEDELED